MNYPVNGLTKQSLCRQCSESIMSAVQHQQLQSSVSVYTAQGAFRHITVVQVSHILAALKAYIGVVLKD